MAEGYGRIGHKGSRKLRPDDFSNYQHYQYNLGAYEEHPEHISVDGYGYRLMWGKNKMGNEFGVVHVISGREWSPVIIAHAEQRKDGKKLVWNAFSYPPREGLPPWPKYFGTYPTWKQAIMAVLRTTPRERSISESMLGHPPGDYIGSLHKFYGREGEQEEELSASMRRIAGQRAKMKKRGKKSMGESMLDRAMRSIRG